MSALRNWLICLVKGHRYDITEIQLQRFTYCSCCGREIFKRSSQIPPRAWPSPLIRASTLGQISLTGGEGQAKEGQEAGENERERAAAAAAVAREAEANVIQAINCGRIAATTSHAIARPRKSLDAQRLPQYVFLSGDANFLKPEHCERRYWAVNLDEVKP